MVVWLLALACDTGSADGSDSETTGGDTTAEDSETGTETDGPTYYADVKPLLAKHCTRCHNEAGLGPGDFTDLDQLIPFSQAIHSAVMDGRMPPPAADPGCQDYEGSDNLNLSDDEKATILSWIDAGSPLGDPEDEPEIPTVSNELADADLTLMMSAPYQPAYADKANPGNEYRCFVLEKPKDKQEFFITALAPVIDQDAIAHHAVLFTASQEEIDAYGDDFYDGDGVDCIDDLSPVDGMLSAWAPGMLPIEFPEGKGIHVDENDQIILQMHYYYSGPDTEGISDLSGYSFRIADSVESTIFMAPLGAYSFQIPAGDDDYTHEGSFYNPYVDLKVYGIFPHMHVLGQRFSASVERADGSETCLVEGEYDFDNQMTYQFTEPVDFGVGETIRFSCNWNNSTSNPDLPFDEPQNTGYGERTDEEMCFFFSFVSLD